MLEHSNGHLVLRDNDNAANMQCVTLVYHHLVVLLIHCNLLFMMEYFLSVLFWTYWLYVVGHSTTAYCRLQEIQEQLQLPKHRLQQDIKTRWNSSLYMVQSVLEVLAAYASEQELAVLTPYQLDLAGLPYSLLKKQLMPYQLIPPP